MINKEFFAALEQLEKEKGIPVDYMLDRVGQALITAYKRENDGMTDNVYVVPDRQGKDIRMFVRKTVVDDVYAVSYTHLGRYRHRGAAQCDVPGRAAQRAQDPDSHLG